MKTTFHLLIFILLAFLENGASGQKVTYKDGSLQLDGAEIAKVVRIKDKGSFGLTATYELHNLKGEKLIIARIASNFVPKRQDNSSSYYQFTFLAQDKIAVFSLGSLGPEKSFARLIGESGIVSGDQLDPVKVNELIAARGENPEVAVEYRTVNRQRIGNPYIKGNDIYQGVTLIGRFKDITRFRDVDSYEFILPDGLVVASVSFRGGNGSKTCQMSTNKDKRTRNITLPGEGTYGELTVRGADVDRNVNVIQSIAIWLSSNFYM